MHLTFCPAKLAFAFSERLQELFPKLKKEGDGDRRLARRLEAAQAQVNG